MIDRYDMIDIDREFCFSLSPETVARYRKLYGDFTTYTAIPHHTHDHTHNDEEITEWPKLKKHT